MLPRRTQTPPLRHDAPIPRRRRSRLLPLILRHGLCPQFLNPRHQNARHPHSSPIRVLDPRPQALGRLRPQRAQHIRPRRPIQAHRPALRPHKQRLHRALQHHMPVSALRQRLLLRLAIPTPRLRLLRHAHRIQHIHMQGPTPCPLRVPRRKRSRPHRAPAAHRIRNGHSQRRRY